MKGTENVFKPQLGGLSKEAERMIAGILKKRWRYDAVSKHHYKFIQNVLAVCLRPSTFHGHMKIMHSFFVHRLLIQMKMV